MRAPTEATDLDRRGGGSQEGARRPTGPDTEEGEGVCGEYFDGLIVGGIGLPPAGLRRRSFSQPVTIHLSQSSLGDQCAKDLFEAAKQDGIEMSFEPEAIRQMAVCGPGTFKSGRMEASLSNYLDNRYRIASATPKPLTANSGSRQS